eukprot:364626-Chlamydomonas_euryale.AAC.4
MLRFLELRYACSEQTQNRCACVGRSRRAMKTRHTPVREADMGCSGMWPHPGRPMSHPPPGQSQN